LIRKVQRDLPKLHEDRARQFVAHRGDQLFLIGKEKHLVYQECYRQGLRADEFIVFRIEPIEEEIWFSPMVSD
jgi:hypothetical protein